MNNSSPEYNTHVDDSIIAYSRNLSVAKKIGTMI